MKLYENPDPMVRNVRIFEEKARKKGFSSVVKDAHKFSEELGTSLNLASPDLPRSSQQAPEKRISRRQVRQHLKKAVEEKFKEKVGDKRWQERLLWTRWEDDQLNEHRCFAWLSGWAKAPTLYYHRGYIWSFMNSSYQSESVRLIRPVLQTKLTPRADVRQGTREHCLRFGGMFIAYAD